MMGTIRAANWAGVGREFRLKRSSYSRTMNSSWGFSLRSFSKTLTLVWDIILSVSTRACLTRS